MSVVDNLTTYVGPEIIVNSRLNSEKPFLRVLRASTLSTKNQSFRNFQFDLERAETWDLFGFKRKKQNKK